MNATYLRYELLRLARNKRLFIFSLAFPVALYLVIAGGNKNQTQQLGGLVVAFPLSYMVAMAAYGSMVAAISGGARIATERATGWNRQLRLTPLTVRSYFGAKVITSYVMSIISIALLYICGLAYGVRIGSAARWIEMTGLLLIGLLPFIALGVLIGHLLTPDSLGPAIGGGAAFLGFLGGLWIPLPNSGFLHQLGQFLPSYWLGQAARVGVGAHAWGVRGWTTVALWFVLFTALAGWAYRRDTERV